MVEEQNEKRGGERVEKIVARDGMEKITMNRNKKRFTVHCYQLIVMEKACMHFAHTHTHSLYFRLSVVASTSQLNQQ